MTIRQQRALETKARISTVALDLFNRYGFTNVTVDQIIEAANSSKGAFYNHFTSKHDIFAEKFKEIDEFYVTELIPNLGEYPSIAEKMKQFFLMQMTYIEQDLGWDITRTIYEQELNTERTSFFMNPDRPLYSILLGFCTEGIQSKEFRQDHKAEELVQVLVRAMRGILYDWSMNKGNYSLSLEQRFLFEVVIEGMKNKEIN